MAKKFGSLVFLAAVAGAAAGVVSYLYKYQKFSEEVDQDFTDVVDSAMEVKDSAKRIKLSMYFFYGKCRHESFFIHAGIDLFIIIITSKARN